MLILDYYVDEPACFGVPPYLSPYCRYSAGALVDGGVAPERIQYLTVDRWRDLGKRLEGSSVPGASIANSTAGAFVGADLDADPELVVLVAGHTVPGKYLGGRIGSVAEVLEFLQYRRAVSGSDAVTLIGGPIRYASPEIRERIRAAGGTLVRGDVELYAYELARASGRPGGVQARLEELLAKHGPGLGARRNYEQVDRWAERGAFLSTLHPNFPYLILELETYRGCTREIFCSFCTEAFYGKPTFRALDGILRETAELARMGNRYFRLGRQADLMTYLPDMQDFQNSFPRPIPASVEALYTGLRRAAPNLELLHLDNINPGLIATFPEESREIIRIISEYNTPGDTAAMGLETADPIVVQLNDLKCSADEALRAIEITNEYGARREGGIPKLLPGINLLHGLVGENDRTFEQNYNFLKEVLDRGLLLRRINIRQTVSYTNTRLEQTQSHLKEHDPADAFISRKRRRPQILEQKFLYFREKIRKEIDQPMLLRNFPPGVKISNVIPETRNQGFVLGRPLGSYPVTIKLPAEDPEVLRAFQEKRALTVIITGAEERSLTGLAWPIALNRLGGQSLDLLPGVGKRRAQKLFLARPIAHYDELAAALEDRPFGEADDYDFAVRETAAAKSG